MNKGSVPVRWHYVDMHIISSFLSFLSFQLYLKSSLLFADNDVC